MKTSVSGIKEGKEMKKTMKKNMLLASIIASSLCLGGAVVATNPVFASANGTESTPVVSFANAFGATVRVSEPNGIRFRIMLSDEKKAEVFGQNSNLTLGMFLFPADKIDSANGNYAGLAQKLNFTFDEEDLYKQDGYWYANGVMTNMYIQNFTKEFVGVGYIYDGTTYEYADLADNERSMYEVASAAYVDTDPLVTPYKDVMANLLEKSIYAAYGVKEKRNEAVVTFTKDANSWATYEELKTANPISISVSATETNLLVGETLDLEATLMVGASEEKTAVTLDIPLEYELSGTSVTLEDGVVTAATPGKTNVTVSFGEYTQTVAVNVVDTQERNHLQGQPDVNMFGTTTEVSLVEKQGNFNGFGSIVGEIESLCIKNGANLSEIENLTIELVDNKLKFTTTEASLVNVLGAYRGNKTVILTTHEKNEDGSLKKIITHNFYLTFADYVFTTYTEIREFSSKLVEANTVTDAFVSQRLSTSVCTNGYFVLGQDIKFNDSNITAKAGYQVSLIGGTFDGQGYTLINPKFYNCALFGVVRNGAVIKDFNVTGGTVAFGSTETSSVSNAGIVAWIAGLGATISNVCAEVKLDGYAKTSHSQSNNAAFGFVMRAAPFGNGTLKISDCAMVVKTATLKSVGTGVGIWCGQGFNTNYVVGTSGTLVSGTMTNCISVVADTNTYNTTVAEFSSVAYNNLTQTNCQYFASWSEYDNATLSGYDADMLAFITGCKG